MNTVTDTAKMQQTIAVINAIAEAPIGTVYLYFSSLDDFHGMIFAWPEIQTLRFSISTSHS